MMKGLTAWGKRLFGKYFCIFLQLAAGLQMCLGWMLSFRILWVLHRSLIVLKSLMLDRWVPMMLWLIISVIECLCSVRSIQRRQQGHRDQPLPAGHHVGQRCRLPVLGETAGQRMQVCHAVFWILVPLFAKLFFNYSAWFSSLYLWVWWCIACMQLCWEFGCISKIY